MASGRQTAPPRTRGRDLVTDSACSPVSPVLSCSDPMFGTVSRGLAFGLRWIDVPLCDSQSPLQRILQQNQQNLQQNIVRQVAVEHPCPPQRVHV